MFLSEWQQSDTVPEELESMFKKNEKLDEHEDLPDVEDPLDPIPIEELEEEEDPEVKEEEEADSDLPDLLEGSDDEDSDVDDEEEEEEEEEDEYMPPLEAQSDKDDLPIHLPSSVATRTRSRLIAERNPASKTSGKNKLK